MILESDGQGVLLTQQPNHCIQDVSSHHGVLHSLQHFLISSVSNEDHYLQLGQCLHQLHHSALGVLRAVCYLQGSGVCEVRNVFYTTYFLQFVTSKLTTLRIRIAENMSYRRHYEPHRPLNPASSRLLSVPQRHYDVIDASTDQVVDSDLHWRQRRSRSVARNAELRDGWKHPGYNDLVVGSRAHPGHHFPRSSTEFCRDMIITSRSPSPAP